MAGTKIPCRQVEFMDIFARNGRQELGLKVLNKRLLRQLCTQGCLRQFGLCVYLIHDVSVVCTEPLNQFL